ncbi:porin family protein (plasmid) [Peteryoungia desertarenae]|uniref:Porin family protein n=1 Tax=Peteryoungia desertarenae TaxID=1813451 RepID=A0ABX6QUU0_9HYPH|nr:outer membrane protein [Peteryoungia desertarenae]QLF72077.1 porin family protein [Peteryoungia desertarenae]
MRLLTITATVLASTSVFAADAVFVAPSAPVALAAESPLMWSGAYLGIHGGAGWLDGDFAVGNLTDTDDFDGGRFGVFGGYQHQMDNNIVVGIEGDLSYDWNENRYAALGINGDVGTDWNGSVRGRLGYAFDKALVYATGGWAITRGTLDVAGVKFDETFNGYTIGGGVDYAVTDKIFGRVEYRFNDFSEESININGTNVSADLKQHTVSVGLGVKF